MTIFEIIYTILIGPLQLIFEIIYSYAYRLLGHPGLAVVALSLIMNILILPLYKRSDAMQEEARLTEEKLREGTTHIKKTFSGDERMMILQTYYRQNNYKPTNALQGSVSLLLEIPFFMAAYNFLSHVNVMQGASMGPIANLGAPDALLSLGGVNVNVLPVIMTLINVISSAIYLKGFPLKTKIQLYGLAAFFLVFLYNSPSGLVFYWILNNVFSLVKNIVYKLYKNPKLTELLGKLPKREKRVSRKTADGKFFFLCSLIPVVIVGILIPSTIIDASTEEFINYLFYNPLWYIVYATCLAIGMFLIWFRIFYWLAKPSGKLVFENALWMMGIVMLLNYMAFGTDLGFLSAELQFDNPLSFTIGEMGINIAVILAVCGVCCFILRKWKKATETVLLTIIIAIAVMSGSKIVDIRETVNVIMVEKGDFEQEMPQFTLSKEGKNVIVLMIDRAMGEYIPYLFAEKPQLKEQFAGFTYYSNVLSFGKCTNFASPVIFGGYEYTPIEMNKRDDEWLVDKHNEALKMMPVLFNENGYEVTVCDPVYANYRWSSDLSIYKDYPEINAYITEGRFGNAETEEYKIPKNKRNFFCFSLMKTLPLALQETFYDGGNYHRVASEDTSKFYLGQKIENNMMAEGIDSLFMNSYMVLENMSQMTVISEEDENTFLMMVNNVTHEPVMLQEPEYVPTWKVDNTPYYQNMEERFVIDGVRLNMDNEVQISHYQINMAALLQLGNWFDYLRENDVYDNTRIILVADHGGVMNQIDALALGGEEQDSVEGYFPLLMVKDFGSQEFKENDEFMTNADVPTLAMENIIANPVNPFTGKEINPLEKTAHEQYVTRSVEPDVQYNNGYTFIPGKWYAVKDNIWDVNNWRAIEEECTIPEELLGENVSK